MKLQNTLALFTVSEGRLRDVLLKECHDGPLAGHGGAKCTTTFLKKSYYWPNLKTMQRNTWRLAWLANKIKHSIRNKQDCCDHYQFLKGRGKMCPWISWWVCHHQRDLMWSWWWCIDLARWHTSFPPRKMPWPKKQEGCSSHMCSNIMASQRTLCWIETQSSWASFGKPRGSRWGRRSRWTPHFDPKRMDKLRKWTWLSNNS